MRLVPLALTLIVAADGCQSREPIPDLDLVFTTSPVFASIVEGITGDSFEVRSLLPPGQSPHSFEPRPSDIRAAARARLLVYGAPNLDEWVVRMPELHRISLMALLPDSMQIPRGADEPNPHFWIDPLAVKAIVGPLTDVLCDLDPSRCPTLQANARRLQQSLDSLHKQLSIELEPLGPTGFVVSHPFLDYFKERYGLRVTNISAGSGNLEPSPRDLARVIQFVTRAGYGAVVTERSEPSPASRTVADAASLKLISVDPLGGDADATSYEQIVSRLAATLLQATE